MTWADGSSAVRSGSQLETSLRAYADSTAGATLGPPSGDASGVTDRVAMQAAIDSVYAGGGGIVRARPNRIYQVNPGASRNVRWPSGSTGTVPVCLVLPSNVTLDMNNSTLQLRGTTLCSLLMNSNADNAGPRNVDIGLLNAVLDGRSFANTAMWFNHFSYLDRLTVVNVKVINTVYEGFKVYDCTNSFFDRLNADSINGNGWSLGDPNTNCPLRDSVLGRLEASNITMLNTGSQPGNPYVWTLQNCTVNSVRCTNTGGAKIQWPSSDVAFGQVVLDGGGEATALNTGFKIQGDKNFAGQPRAVRISVDQVIAKNLASIGLLMVHTQDCRIGSFIGYNNTQLHPAGSDVWLAGGIGDFIGSIRSDKSGGGGLLLSDSAEALTGPTRLRIGTVLVTNPGQRTAGLIKAGVRGDVAFDAVIDDVTTIDDQGTHTMDYGLDVEVTTATGKIKYFSSSGQTTAAKFNGSAGFVVP